MYRCIVVSLYCCCTHSSYHIAAFILVQEAMTAGLKSASRLSPKLCPSSLSKLTLSISHHSPSRHPTSILAHLPTHIKCCHPLPPSPPARIYTPAVILLSFILAAGFLLIILSCALWANWLPLLVGKSRIPRMVTSDG